MSCFKHTSAGWGKMGSNRQCQIYHLMWCAALFIFSCVHGHVWSLKMLILVLLNFPPYLLIFILIFVSSKFQDNFFMIFFAFLLFCFWNLKLMLLSLYNGWPYRINNIFLYVKIWQGIFSNFYLFNLSVSSRISKLRKVKINIFLNL